MCPAAVRHTEVNIFYTGRTAAYTQSAADFRFTYINLSGDHPDVHSHATDH